MSSGGLLLFLARLTRDPSTPAPAEPCSGRRMHSDGPHSLPPRPCPRGFGHRLHALPRKPLSSSSLGVLGIHPGNQHRDFSVEKQTGHLPPTPHSPKRGNNKTRTPRPKLCVRAQQPCKEPALCLCAVFSEARALLRAGGGLGTPERWLAGCSDCGLTLA